MKYPWYDIVSGRSLEQGDILEDFPIYIPPSELNLSRESTIEAEFTVETRDLIIMSQSCDLVEGRSKVDEVITCPVWSRDQLKFKNDDMEKIRKGNRPPYHLLAKCEFPGFEREVRIVGFNQMFTLPVDHVRYLAEEAAKRIRLMPPYREHLSQAYARFFMRVGLPTDIPPFTR